MSQESAAPRAERAHATGAASAGVRAGRRLSPPQPPAKPAGGSRVGAIIVLMLIVVSLAWYFVSDRLTPHTSQARVQAFVVPVAAEVAGQSAEGARQEQRRGAARTAACSTSIRRRTGSRCNAAAPTTSRCDARSMPRGSAVEAARAGLQAADGRAASTPSRTRRDWSRSMRRIRARFRSAASRMRRPAGSRRAARRRPPRPICAAPGRAAGERGENNAQLISARSAVEKAELDLKRTKVVAPSRGVGHRPAHRRRPVRAARRAGDDADRHPRSLDQRRHDREQPRQHQARRPGRDRARRACRARC